MTALPQAALPLLRPRRAKKVLYGRKQRQDHNGAWGELLPGSFDSVGLALRFVGGLGVRTDLQTGLMYMRHRWYDATLQRFISMDPIGLRGGVNLYGYAHLSPTDLNDPMGHRPRGWSPKPLLKPGPSWSESLGAQYVYCYNKLLREWGSDALPYQTWPGGYNNLTVVFHMWFYKTDGGCTNWQKGLLDCLQNSQKEGNLKTWRIAEVDIYTLPGLWNPGFTHHAILATPIDEPSPMSSGRTRVLDPWITGQPDLYDLPTWFNSMPGATLQDDPVFGGKAVLPK